MYKQRLANYWYEKEKFYSGPIEPSKLFKKSYDTIPELNTWVGKRVKVSTGSPEVSLGIEVEGTLKSDGVETDSSEIKLPPKEKILGVKRKMGNNAIEIYSENMIMRIELAEKPVEAESFGSKRNAFVNYYKRKSEFYGAKE